MTGDLWHHIGFRKLWLGKTISSLGSQITFVALPLTAVPELNERTHLPVVVDPSHGTGHAHLVPAMCRAAIAAGADGLMVEVHHDPEHAMSDGAQSITPAVMAGLMPVLKRIAVAIGREM